MIFKGSLLLPGTRAIDDTQPYGSGVSMAMTSTGRAEASRRPLRKAPMKGVILAGKSRSGPGLFDASAKVVRRWQPGRSAVRHDTGTY